MNPVKSYRKWRLERNIQKAALFLKREAKKTADLEGFYQVGEPEEEHDIHSGE